MAYAYTHMFMYRSKYMYCFQIEHVNFGLVSDVADNCDLSAGWHQYNSKCYRQYDDKKTWYDALAHCQSESGTLVMLKTQDEINAFSHLQYCNDYQAAIWIGLSDTVRTATVLQTGNSNLG